MAVDPGAAAATLVEAASERLERALALDRPEVAGFLARARSLAGWMPDLGLPLFEDAEMRELLPALCSGRRSFEELRRAPLLDALLGALSWRQREALDREAPEAVQVPSGSRVRLAYVPGRAPVLAVRIQELFGLAETPRIAGGRVRIVLHLLAPNGRPQQVTDDLRGFWDRTWPEVRGELRARYPKHAWPEDPWTAQPRRRR
jgi:ATP-dependent helicase HrpB